MKTLLKSILVLAGLANLASACAQNTPLSREQSDAKATEIIQEWKTSQFPLLRVNVDSMVICQDDLKMRFSASVFGEKPADGRSLWISMHGGGNAPAALNESQWENQKLLYQPAEGIYLCPRAPWDDWDMWFKNPLDSIFEELIRTLVVCCEVNPDKVYLMGYSAGGDGVWRMAPRMADHWAAASMMAGHPGDVRLESLLNLPFMIWCGGEDAAYDRNRECEQRGLLMDSLQRVHADGFVHETHIVAGKPHWMDLEDRAALPWMAQHQRNPYPQHVIWCQGDNPRTAFYWLGVPADEASKGKMLSAHIQGNDIIIDQCDYSRVTLYLNDSLVNLDRPVRVRHGKRTIFKGRLTRTAENLRTTLATRQDPSYVFPAVISVELKR